MRHAELGKSVKRAWLNPVIWPWKEKCKSFALIVINIERRWAELSHMAEDGEDIDAICCDSIVHSSAFGPPLLRHKVSKRQAALSIGKDNETRQSPSRA